MAKLAEGIRIVDADSHMTERHDLFTERAPKGFEDKVPHVVEIDGRDMWVVDGHTFGKAGSGGTVDRDGRRAPVPRLPGRVVGNRRRAPFGVGPRRAAEDHGRVPHRHADHLSERDRHRRAEPRQHRELDVPGQLLVFDVLDALQDDEVFRFFNCGAAGLVGLGCSVGARFGGTWSIGFWLGFDNGFDWGRGSVLRCKGQIDGPFVAEEILIAVGPQLSLHLPAGDLELERFNERRPKRSSVRGVDDFAAEDATIFMAGDDQGIAVVAEACLHLGTWGGGVIALGHNDPQRGFVRKCFTRHSGNEVELAFLAVAEELAGDSQFGEFRGGLSCSTAENVPQQRDVERNVEGNFKVIFAFHSPSVALPTTRPFSSFRPPAISPRGPPMEVPEA